MSFLTYIAADDTIPASDLLWPLCIGGEDIYTEKQYVAEVVPDLKEMDELLELLKHLAVKTGVIEIWRIWQGIEYRPVIRSKVIPLDNLTVLWFAGMKGDARTVAKKALDELDEVLRQHLTDEALFRSRRSLVLAILGREEEAREELAHVRTMPLCEFCEYGKCKDADIYEAAIEDICGNRSKALELYRAGRKNWPDELDFMSGEVRTKRKTK